MWALCTCCSASKNKAPGSLPASQRYKSARIARVHDLAVQQGAHFLILSGKYGLVEWDQPLPWYDHLLRDDEVAHLIPMVRQQLRDKGVTRLDYYASAPADDPQSNPYTAAIVGACDGAGVALSLHHLEEATMTGNSGWRVIWAKAQSAIEALIRDRVEGEKAFDALVARHPDDGMVYFERGSGYEFRGEPQFALPDYETAERLFPWETWRAKARAGANRVRVTIPMYATVEEAERNIRALKSVDKALQWEALEAIAKVSTSPDDAVKALRLCAEHIARFLLQRQGQRTPEDLDTMIRILVQKQIITEITGRHLDTIRVIGNLAIHRPLGDPPLRLMDAMPCVTAMAAILTDLDS